MLRAVKVSREMIALFYGGPSCSVMMCDALEVNGGFNGLQRPSARVFLVLFMYPLVI